MRNETVRIDGRPSGWPAGLMLLLVFVVLVRTAWISDDAMITLRTVLNLVNGYGATFNLDERVQAYTHPLWFGILSLFSAFDQNVFLVTFATQIVISLLVFYLLFKHLSIDLWNGILAVLVLVGSKAYIDYSTSGLENPLSHLMMLLCVMVLIRVFDSPLPDVRKSASALFVIGTLYLVRPDLILCMVPAGAMMLWKVRKDFQLMGSLLLLASFPILLWTLFSLFYYGFPFPNTAYAKLGAGISLSERVPQGLWYLLDSLQRDPITVTFIIIGVLAGMFGSRLMKTLSAGVVLYILYVISIGGDFMAGRFLTTPLLLAVTIIALTQFQTIQLKVLYGLIAVFVMVMALGGTSSLFSGPAYQNSQISKHGITDERGFYFQYTGLWTAGGYMTSTYVGHPLPRWILRVGPRKVSDLCGMLGLNGLFDGPTAHLIDTCGLSDPLLARLPAKHERVWRIGHHFRDFPAGYVDSVRDRSNVIEDADTRKYYESIRVITRSEIFDVDRLKEILRMNLGMVKLKDDTLAMYTRGLTTPAAE